MERGATIETLAAAVEFVERTGGPTLVVGQRVTDGREYELHVAGVGDDLAGEQARRLLQTVQIAHANATDGGPLVEYGCDWDGDGIACATVGTDLRDRFAAAVERGPTPTPARMPAFHAVCLETGDGRLLVGLRGHDAELVTEERPTLVHVDGRFELLSGPSLPVDDRFDALYFDGLLFVFDPTTLRPFLDRTVGGPPAHDPGDADRPTVLVVDDDESLVDLYVARLSGEYDVRTATDGRAALAAMDDDVDVVLLDRRMPNLSGDEVLRSVRERYDCRVAMMTAVDPSLDIVDLPFDAYLKKPFGLGELTDTVEDLLVADADDAGLELSSLRVRRNILRAELPTAALADDEEFRRLEARIAALERHVDAVPDR